MVFVWFCPKRYVLYTFFLQNICFIMALLWLRLSGVMLRALCLDGCCFTWLGLLFGGRQQRVRRPSNKGCDDRQQRC